MIHIIGSGCRSAAKTSSTGFGEKQVKNAETYPIETFSGPAKIKFDSSSYHLGSIKAGEIKKFEIPFVNVGAERLEIRLISACECTTVDWPSLAIEPGGRRTLKVAYNSKDKKGAQIVDLEILANTEPSSTFIKFELFVMD